MNRNQPNPENQPTNSNQPPVPNEQNRASNQTEIVRPTLEQAKNKSWWRRLFGGTPQTPEEARFANARNAADKARALRSEGINAREEQRGLSRSIESHLTRQPKDVHEMISMIEQLDEKQWRERKLKEKYGEGTIGKIKQFLAGENTITYDRRGEVKYNWLNDFLRRGASIITDRRIIAGALSLAVVGILTGGVGAVALGGLYGALGGRAIGEAYEAIVGKEKKLRMLIAQRQYEHWQDLRTMAQELRSSQTDEERIKRLNKIIDEFYNTSADITNAETSIAKEKQNMDKIKGILTIAGGAIGVGSALYGEWIKTSQEGVKLVQMYDFDKNGAWHSIARENGKYIYHIRDAQGHIIGTHDLGGTPTAEMLKQFKTFVFKDPQLQQKAMETFGMKFGEGLGTLLGMGAAHQFMKPRYEEYETTSEEIAHAKKQISKQIPAVETVSTPEEKENEPKIGQIWTFKFVNIQGKLQDADNYVGLMHKNRFEVPDAFNINNKLKIPFGSYKIIKLTGENVELLLMDPKNPSESLKEKDHKEYKVTIPKKFLSQSGNLDQRSPEDQVYEPNMLQLAEHYENVLPEKDQIVKFSKSSFKSLFGKDITLPTGANRFRIIQIKNNMISFEILEDDKDVKKAGTKELKIHIADYLKNAILEKNPKDIDDVLEELDIDINNPEASRFLSPQPAIKDIYGHNIPEGEIFKIVKINKKQGIAILEAEKEITDSAGKKTRPRIFVNISDLKTAGWQPQAKKKHESEPSEDEEKKEKDKYKIFKDMLVKDGVLDEEDKDKVSKGSIFEYNNKLYILNKFNYEEKNPDNSDVVLYDIVTKTVNKKQLREAGTSREIIKYKDFKKANFRADIKI